MARALEGGPFHGKPCPDEHGNCEFFVRRFVNDEWINVPATYLDFTFIGYVMDDIPEAKVDLKTTKKRKSFVKQLINKNTEDEDLPF